jgi:hypothetical protein
MAARHGKETSNPPSILSQFKEWAGVVSLVLSVAYTFPLGVWDRFIETPRQRASKELSDLRTVLVRLAELEAKSLQTNAGITDQNAAALNSLAVWQQKRALLTSSLPLIKERYPALTATEKWGLGKYVSTILNDAALANTMFEAVVEESARDNDHIIEGLAYRAKAELYLGAPRGAEISKVRINFANSLRALQLDAGNAGITEGVVTAIEWSFAEYGDGGNPACGKELAKWAHPHIGRLNADWAAAIRESVEKYATSEGTSADKQECPKEIIPWSVAGWPWKPLN